VQILFTLVRGLFEELDPVQFEELGPVQFPAPVRESAAELVPVRVRELGRELVREPGRARAAMQESRAALVR
jgi:hypothetical protein